MNSKLIILQIIPNLAIGGAEVMVSNLALELSALGQDVVIVSLYEHHSSITERLESRGIKIKYLGKKKGLDFRILFRIRKLIRLEKPNVVHTHLGAFPYFMIGSVFIRTKRFHTVHTVASKEVSKFMRILYKIFYKLFDAVPVAISPNIKKSIAEYYNLNFQRIPMIYNGINLCLENIKENYHIGEQLTIIHVGNFKKEKNHSMIIDAFKIINDKIPNSILQLIGQGGLEISIKNKVVDLNLSNNVKFMGLQNDVFRYLKQADIFILPSIWEGMPISLIEAMSVGLPIVVTKVGGIVDMITNDLDGLLIDLTANDLSDAVLRLTTDQSYRERLGKQALSNSNRFSAIIMAEEYLKLYNNKTNKFD